MEEFNFKECLEKFEQNHSVDLEFYKMLQQNPSFEMTIGQPFPGEYSPHQEPEG